MTDALFKAPFAEQLDYFRGKLNLPTERWDDILGAAHDRAFIVAGAMQADLLTDLRGAVDRAIADGTGLEAFRRDFARIVQRHGWDYNGGFDWRTQVIYQTNLRASYAAGRWAQLHDPALLKSRPYWRYVHSDAVQHPRPLHLSWNGLVLRHDDPWWQTHFPPNGWGCQCRVVAATEGQYQAAKKNRAPSDGTWTHIDSRGAEHEIPSGIDYGWAHAPGRGVEASWSQLIADKLIRWDARIGSAAFEEMGDRLVPALTREFSDWADGVEHKTGEVRVVGALSQQVVARLAALGIEPDSAHLSVRDEDVVHAHRTNKVDPVHWAWYRELPAHLADPAAVLLDKSKQSPALLYVFNAPGVDPATKMVALLDYTVKQRTPGRKIERPRMNILRTGRTMGSKALNDRVSYELLEGEV